MHCNQSQELEQNKAALAPSSALHKGCGESNSVWGTCSFPGSDTQGVPRELEDGEREAELSVGLIYNKCVPSTQILLSDPTEPLQTLYGS